MSGMFLGSLLFSRFVSERHHPFKVYGLLEFGIALFGFAMPFALPVISYLYVVNTDYGYTNILLRALLCMICLLPPTILMGATLPAISR